MATMNCIGADTNQFLKLSGGTLTGNLTLNDSPTTDLQAATKAYADSVAPPYNVIIGGDFGTNPWQRGTSFASVANSTYTADRWIYNKIGTGAGVINIAKTADAPTAAQAGYLSTSSFLITVTTNTSTIAAGDAYFFRQIVEGLNFESLAQNPMALSFWVKSSTTGVYCVALRNSGNDRSVVMEYTINSANTWQYVSMVIPSSPSGGTWTYNNGKGIDVNFTLASGSTMQTTAGSWNTGNFVATSNQSNFFVTNGSTFQVDLIQLQSGSYATGFQKRSIVKELQMCMRYYEKTYSQGTNPATNTAVGSFNVSNSAIVAGANDNTQRFKVPKRTTPTMTIYSIAGTTGKVTQDNGTEINASATQIGDAGFRLTSTNGAGRYGQAGHYQAVAEL